ncbi:MAG: LysR family transcriptional regulator [Myxococcota bacterium]
MSKLSEMEAYVAVVREGGFSAAARKLGLTPSALSKQVGRLEQRLEVSLLHRNTRHVQLTEVGRAYYEGSRAIVQQIVDLEDRVTEHRGGPRGTVRVSLPPGLMRTQILGMLNDFYRRYPDVRLVFESSDRFLDLVDEGIDVAVRVGELADSSLIARRIARFHRIVVAAPQYIEEHGAPQAPAELADHNCLAVGVNQRSMNRWEFVGPDGPELITVSGNFETNTMEALHDAAVAGIGIARVSPLLAAPALAAGELLPLLERFVPPARSTLQVVYPPKRHLSGAVRVFIDALVDHLTKASATIGLGLTGAEPTPAAAP